MKTYARLQNGLVAEFLSTTADISTLFNPALTWIDVTGNTSVQVGWEALPTGGFAAAPPAPVPPGAAVSVLTLAQLQAQLALLQAQLPIAASLGSATPGAAGSAAVAPAPTAPAAAASS